MHNDGEELGSFVRPHAHCLLKLTFCVALVAKYNVFNHPLLYCALECVTQCATASLGERMYVVMQHVVYTIGVSFLTGTLASAIIAGSVTG